MWSLAIQEADFDVAEELRRIEETGADCGAVVTFVGKVRGKDHQQPLAGLFLTHMAGTTEAELGKVLQDACERWQLHHARAIHRVGQLAVGEQIVLVATASSHRDDAYRANRFIMDYLKTEVPLWKKECFADGSSRWVEMKASDVQEQQNWQNRHD